MLTYILNWFWNIRHRKLISWKQYFGFSAKQLAGYLGLGQSSFTEIMKGKWSIAEKHEGRFNEMFEEFKIIEKTKDFKETPEQVWQREWWQKQRNTEKKT